MPGEPEVTGVRLDDLHGRVCEALPQRAGATRMQLDSDHTGTARHEMRGDRASAGAHVEHQVASRDIGVVDETTGPAVS